MTRKDYVAIAAAIEAAQKHNPWPTAEGAHASRLVKQTIAQNLCGIFSQDNPRFDRGRFFLQACGVANNG